MAAEHEPAHNMYVYDGACRGNAVRFNGFVRYIQSNRRYSHYLMLFISFLLKEVSRSSFFFFKLKKS